MIWHFIDSGFDTGERNMQFDLYLAQTCDRDEAFFRIYRWQPYCISLGANQSFCNINLDRAIADGIDIVKRPTGGRAILHAEELTYTVILPLNDRFHLREIYFKISAALMHGLKIYNPLLAKSELENYQPNFPKLLEEPSGVLCFASTARNEVKFNGKKLIGSAQRKLNNVVLQHGSILCGTKHQELPKYLNANENTKERLQIELTEKTTEIETILGEKTDYQKLKTCLMVGFELEWQIRFEKIPWQGNFTAKQYLFHQQHLT